MFGSTRTALNDPSWFDPHWSSLYENDYLKKLDFQDYKFSNFPIESNKTAVSSNFSRANANFKSIESKYDLEKIDPKENPLKESDVTANNQLNDQNKNLDKLEKSLTDRAETESESNLVDKWKEQQATNVEKESNDTDINIMDDSSSEIPIKNNKPKNSRNIIVIAPCCCVIVLIPSFIVIGTACAFIWLNIPTATTVSTTLITTLITTTTSTTTTSTTTTPCSNLQYYDVDKCRSRLGEFSLCSFDYMCLMPMTCDLNIGCICTTGLYFDINTLNCQQKLSYNGSCSSNHMCDETQNLVCDIINSKCVCSSSTLTWSSNQKACKLTLNQGICSLDSDCNLSEYLSCDINGLCDCIRTDGYESYFDALNNKCTPVLTYNQEGCSSDEMCSSMTERTYCNTLSKKCECPQQGYLMQDGKCSFCKIDESYFQDKCYLIVEENNIEADKIERKCKQKGSVPAVLDSLLLLEHFKTLTKSLENYWISGRLSNSIWTWGSTSKSLLVNTTVCPLSNSNGYLNYYNGCYNSDLRRGANSPYICQR